MPSYKSSFRAFRSYKDIYLCNTHSTTTLLLHTLHTEVQHFEVQSETPLQLRNVQV